MSKCFEIKLQSRPYILSVQVMLDFCQMGQIPINMAILSKESEVKKRMKKKTWQRVKVVKSLSAYDDYKTNW